MCPLAYKSDLMKVGVLRCREEPPKLLQGNKFQERSFQIKKNKLLLLKDKKVVSGSPTFECGPTCSRLFLAFRASGRRRSGR